MRSLVFCDMQTSLERHRQHSTRHDAERAAIHAEIARLEKLAYWMDRRFRIPFTPIRLGADGLIGLVPGIGDAAALVPALYLVARARQMGAPAQLQGRMAANVLFDLLIGVVPLVGDLLDIGFKANTRNVRMLREHFGAPPAEHAPAGDR
jgi:hypothetical protein